MTSNCKEVSDFLCMEPIASGGTDDRCINYSRPMPAPLKLLVYPLCYDDRLHSGGKRNASVWCLSVCLVMTRQEAALEAASTHFVSNVAPSILFVEAEAHKHIMGMPRNNNKRHRIKLQ